jgi:hypothetical protein
VAAAGAAAAAVMTRSTGACGRQKAMSERL